MVRFHALHETRDATQFPRREAPLDTTPANSAQRVVEGSRPLLVQWQAARREMADDEPTRWITLPEVTGNLLEEALVERQAYRLEAALLLYDAAAVSLAATAAATDLQSSGGTAADVDAGDALDELYYSISRSAPPKSRRASINSAAQRLETQVDAMRSDGHAFVELLPNPSELSTQLLAQQRQAMFGAAECARLLMRPQEVRRRLASLRALAQPSADRPTLRLAKEAGAAVAIQEFMLELCCGDGSEGSGQGNVARLLASAKQLGRLGPPAWAIRLMGKGWEALAEAHAAEAKAEAEDAPPRAGRLQELQLLMLDDKQLLLDMALASVRAARPADAAACLSRTAEEDSEWQVPWTACLPQQPTEVEVEVAAPWPPPEQRVQVVALLRARGEWLDASLLPGEAYASYACAAQLLDDAAHDAAAETPLGVPELQLQLQLGWWLSSACAEAGDAAAAAKWLRQTLVVQAASQ
jgi:hypothetical protein